MPVDVGPQAQARVSPAAVGARRFGLQPVSSDRLNCLAALQVACRLGFRLPSIEVAEPVVVLRPVDQRDVAAEAPGREVACVGRCGGRARGSVPAGLASRVGSNITLRRFERDRVGHRPAQQLPGHGGVSAGT